MHNGDTWGIPGGARDSHETVLEAATREAEEEIGININLFDPLSTFTDNHGDWRYDTIIARAHHDLIPHEMNEESLQVEWVFMDQLSNKNLHPSFEGSWPALQTLLGELGI